MRTAGLGWTDCAAFPQQKALTIHRRLLPTLLARFHKTRHQPMSPECAGARSTNTSLSLSVTVGAGDQPNQRSPQHRPPQHPPVWHGWHIQPFPSGKVCAAMPVGCGVRAADICRDWLAAQRATFTILPVFLPICRTRGRTPVRCRKWQETCAKFRLARNEVSPESAKGRLAKGGQRKRLPLSEPRKRVMPTSKGLRAVNRRRSEGGVKSVSKGEGNLLAPKEECREVRENNG